MSSGYLCLFLHAHLPFVRHPEHESFLEENWLFEAITETYVPLLSVFSKLEADKIPFRIAMSLTPTLVSMLSDELLQKRYVRYIVNLIDLAGKEVERTAFDPAYAALARFYLKNFITIKDLFCSRYNNNLVPAFSALQKKGVLEIVASCATHGFLPNLSVNPASVRAQIAIGIESYEQTFGQKPVGFWLPECGFAPGLDEVLKGEGIRYFFLDSHGLLHGEPVPRYSVYAPVFCPSGVAAFGRDPESSAQVWSSKDGYPGDADYREYYRDIGFELELDYIKPYMHVDGVRTNTGIKYWKVTGKTELKEIYNPEAASKKAEEHARDFYAKRLAQIDDLGRTMDRKPMVCAPYDAELFGHWWYEGPQWIDSLARIVACGDALSLITPSEYLSLYPRNLLCLPSASSWGKRGYNEFWLNSENEWIYPHLHMAGKRMVELADVYGGKVNRNPLLKRALNLAGRELLLAESSDWPFIMTTGTMVPYAAKRVKQHIGRFTQLYNDMMGKKISELWIAEVEKRDTVFSTIDCYKYYMAKKGRKTQ